MQPGNPAAGAATKRIALAAGVLLLLPPAPAVAQDAQDVRVRVGLGAQIRPDYPGSDGYGWGPLVDFSIKRGPGHFNFEAPDDSFDIGLISSGGFSAGPVANIQQGRDQSDVGAPVGRVKTTIEAGGFVQYDLSEAVRLRGEVRQGLGGHRGLIASIGGDYVWRDGDRYVFSVGPRVLFSDARYQRSFFGVTPAAATASGLPVYRPDAGLHAVGATSSLYTQLGGPWGLFGYGRYERLVGDAGRSPIVREYGSRNQLSAGAGVTYIFNIRL